MHPQPRVSSFRGARQREPGIHNHEIRVGRFVSSGFQNRQRWLWIPGLRQAAHPGMTVPDSSRSLLAMTAVHIGR
jgi:hypothetical protein